MLTFLKYSNTFELTILKKTGKIKQNVWKNPSNILEKESDDTKQATRITCQLSLFIIT